jgi:hypothetical protein
MNADNASQLLQELDPVPKPPPGPTYEHIVGNQIRWTVKMLRYMRYKRRRRKLEELVAIQQSGDLGVANRPR